LSLISFAITHSYRAAADHLTIKSATEFAAILGKPE
jgi:hypothetical protein